MNNNEIINQIKESLDIADLIGDKVRLRKTSRGFMGLCPFHTEDTPSFHVYTDTQSYYCFGCHAAGDIFSFLMRSEDLTFHEALKILAEKAGVKLNDYHHDEIDSRKVLEMASWFFSSTLKGAQGVAARAYMKRRQLNASDIDTFSLGYSPNSWDALTRYLRSKGIPDKAILDAGLAHTNSRGLYDSFRGRLIFPIKDVTGRVIAFGGRLIDGEGAKYINSPESANYSKRRNLYLLDVARKAMREKNRSILVEGYMDAVRLHKCGFTESVASLGTSLTKEQAEILSRYADRCYICYDSDAAGQSAAIKGMYILAEHGLRVYVVNLPKGKDPDEFLCSNPPEKFEEALEKARPLILKHVDYLRPALNDEVKRHSALKELFSELRKLKLYDVLEYMGSICDATGLHPDVVRQYLIEDNMTEVRPAAPEREAVSEATSNVVESSEAAMCFLLLESSYARLRLSCSEAGKIFSSETAKVAALALLTENPEAQELLWRELGDEKIISLLNTGRVECAKMGKIDNAEKFGGMYRLLKVRSIEREISTIQSQPVTQRDMSRLTELFVQRELYSR